ncbi:TPA: hypothetical protein MYO83_005611 [Klebsiella michiganensis]|nr:hypothetical protein [Klebsiella michiganensis]HCB1849117.1 hypothetical protein [Klebsiella oxytoca]
MKIKSSQLTTGQTLMALIGIIVFALGFSILIVWLLLNVWNWFAYSAGLNAEIPINFATVFGPGSFALS